MVLAKNLFDVKPREISRVKVLTIPRHDVQFDKALGVKEPIQVVMDDG